MDLETLRTQCLSCTRCPLHTTRTNVVFGQGVPTAEVLLTAKKHACAPSFLHAFAIYF